MQQMAPTLPYLLVFLLAGVGVEGGEWNQIIRQHKSDTHPCSTSEYAHIPFLRLPKKLPYLSLNTKGGHLRQSII
jgi:hypothetical protein